MKNQRRISTLIVHRMQREVALLVVVMLTITTVSVAFLIHWTLEEAIRQAGQQQISGGAIEALRVFKRILLDRVFISLTIGIFVIGFFVARALHRATGPLNRIMRTLRAVGDGHAPREMVIRERDYFVELAGEVNHVIRRFKAMEAERGDGKS